MDTKHSEHILQTLINLCDDMAWGRPCDADSLFALTKQGSATPELERLAEAFGLMTVKVEAREFQRAALLEKLEQYNKENILLREQLHGQVAQVPPLAQNEYNVRRIIGQCPSMQAIVQQALAIARHPINTLILGPSGTGKEVIAKTIHYHSPRHKAPFVAVNCTAIPESLFESQMFGIEKGVATGVNARKGLIEEASGGTLFLDELADMSLANQAKLLRVLEEREVVRVGSVKAVPVDIKVIAATNADLTTAVHEGKFREDLYYRLNVAELHLPPLKERGDDILILARYLLKQHVQLMGRPPLSLTPATRQCLLAYPWPGNVRELNNEMERAAALTVGNKIRPSDLSLRILQCLGKSGSIYVAPRNNPSMQIPTHMLPANAPTPATVSEAPTVQHATVAPLETITILPHAPASLNLEECERHIILQALTRSQGNKSHAATLLGITREGLRKKLLRLGIKDADKG